MAWAITDRLCVLVVAVIKMTSTGLRCRENEPVSYYQQDVAVRSLAWPET